jgi:hypothetical protein
VPSPNKISPQEERCSEWVNKPLQTGVTKGLNILGTDVTNRRLNV